MKDDAGAESKDEKKDVKGSGTEEANEPLEDKANPKACGMMRSNPKDVYLQVIPVKLSSDTRSLTLTEYLTLAVKSHWYAEM